ncbi:hypothetical protein GH714_030762 [Hevea brasiliensis]|uniref:Uncharacterized protein n=1 Tax=Hevea brasiliensis TaxID=3981 RepID=A0A6A6LSJ0_HEVBR|nr:hypothetical protein GH714_030762 [Hevea brasiliensis]
MHQPSSVAANVLGADAGPSNIHQTIGVAGETQNSQRNIRLRRATKDEQLGFADINYTVSHGLPEDSDLDEEIEDEMTEPSSVVASGLGVGAGPSNIPQTIVEENDGVEGCSLDGRRLYYKRRAPEDEQLGTRLVLTLETAPIMHQPSSVAVSGLGAGVGPSDIHQTIGPSDIHQIIGVAREAQHSQRNILLRRVPADEQLGAGLVISLESAPVMHQPLSVAASGLGASAGPSDTHQTISEVGEAQHSQRTVNHQDFLPTNLATWTIRNSHPQLTAQLAIHLSFDCVPKTSSVTAIVQPTPPMQQPIPVSYFLESMQPFQWNDVTRSRTGIPFTSTYTLNGGDASLVEGNSRNSRNSKKWHASF